MSLAADQSNLCSYSMENTTKLSAYFGQMFLIKYQHFSSWLTLRTGPHLVHLVSLPLRYYLLKKIMKYVLEHSPLFSKISSFYTPVPSVELINIVIGCGVQLIPQTGSLELLHFNYMNLNEWSQLGIICKACQKSVFQMNRISDKVLIICKSPTPQTSCCAFSVSSASHYSKKHCFVHESDDGINQDQQKCDVQYFVHYF